MHIFKLFGKPFQRHLIAYTEHTVNRSSKAKALCFCGGIYRHKHTKNYFCDRKYFCRCIW